MLWYKSWLETRWRFLIGLALLMLLGVRHRARPIPQVHEAAAAGAARSTSSGEIGRRISEAAGAGARLPRLRLVAVVPAEPAADVGAVRGAARHRRPARRRRPAAGRCSRCRCRSRAAGCSACAPRPGSPNCWCSRSCPRCCMPLLSPAVGQSYGVGDALVHGACLFIAGAVFFSLAFLLSTVFSDVWRPLLIVLCVGGRAGARRAGRFAACRATACSG